MANLKSICGVMISMHERDSTNDKPCVLNEGHPGECSPVLPLAACPDCGHDWDRHTGSCHYIGDCSGRECGCQCKPLAAPLSQSEDYGFPNTCVVCGRRNCTLKHEVAAPLPEPTIGDTLFREAVAANLMPETVAVGNDNTKPLTDDEWIRTMATKEDGCFVNIGSPSVSPLPEDVIARMIQEVAPYPLCVSTETVKQLRPLLEELAKRRAMEVLIGEGELPPLPDPTEAESEQIRKWMKENKYYPSAYWSLVSINQRRERQLREALSRLRSQEKV